MYVGANNIYHYSMERYLICFDFNLVQKFPGAVNFGIDNWTIMRLASAINLLKKEKQNVFTTTKSIKKIISIIITDLNRINEPAFSSVKHLWLPINLEENVTQ